jgi:tetratricopeptide (TPR) repeat protein
MPTPPSSDPSRRGRGKPPSGGRPPRSGGRPPQDRVSEGPPWKRRQEQADAKGKAAGWGGVARKGAGYVGATNGPGTASQAFRDAADGGRDWEPEQWIDEGVVRDEATNAVGRGRAPSKAAKAPRAPREVDDEGAVADPSIERAVGAAKADRVEQRLKEASRAFRRDRFEEARKILRPLAESAPTAVSVRELLGLSYYRLGRWKQAVAELEAFRDLTGSTEQHPVLADCYRAMGRHQQVQELWEELRSVSPSAALVAEGRIVAAGSLADQGELKDAISLLEAAKHPGKRPQEHHLRVAYALADLYERAGDVPKARQLFHVVASADPELGDAALRYRALG